MACFMYRPMLQLKSSTLQDRIQQWWLFTPHRPQLDMCIGALALHLGGRLGLVWPQLIRPPLEGARRQMHAPPPPSEQQRANAGCEWVTDKELQLPDFPRFPHPYDGQLEIRLPPLPGWRLLPHPAWRQALKSPPTPRKQTVSASLDGGGWVVIAVGLVCFMLTGLSACAAVRALIPRATKRAGFRMARV